MQQRSACSGDHGRDQAIEQTTRSDANRSAALVEVGSGLEVVARVHEFNVEALQQSTKFANFSVRSRADEQLGLHWLEQEHLAR